jgi:hypothetical protein
MPANVTSYPGQHVGRVRVHRSAETCRIIGVINSKTQFCQDLTSRPSVIDSLFLQEISVFSSRVVSLPPQTFFVINRSRLGRARNESK